LVRLPLWAEIWKVSPRPRKFAVEKLALMNVPSSPLTPPPNVNWLRFCSVTLKVTSMRSSPRLLGPSSGTPFDGLEVAELVDAPDGDLSASVLKRSPSFR
jgi:hypothetical protein